MSGSMVRRDEWQEKYHQPQWKYIHVCDRAGVVEFVSVADSAVDYVTNRLNSKNMLSKIVFIQFDRSINVFVGYGC